MGRVALVPTVFGPTHTTGSRYVAQWLSVAVLAAACSRPPASVATVGGLREATCVGPAAATHYAVYLHGIDSPSISEQELDNRRILERLARSLSIRIALPRATHACQNDPSQVCWGWAFGRDEVDAASASVTHAAASCFDASASFGLIGFSNGGYLLTKMLRTCELHQKIPNASWMLTIGSGMNHGTLEAKPEDLSECGRLVMLVGTSDRYNFDPDESLLHGLERKRANVRSVRYEGGHLIPEEATGSALTELLR